MVKYTLIITPNICCGAGFRGVGIYPSGDIETGGNGYLLSENIKLISCYIYCFGGNRKADEWYRTLAEGKIPQELWEEINKEEYKYTLIYEGPGVYFPVKGKKEYRIYRKTKDEKLIESLLYKYPYGKLEPNTLELIENRIKQKIRLEVFRIAKRHGFIPHDLIEAGNNYYYFSDGKNGLYIFKTKEGFKAVKQ